jgi:hypothetical protein
VLSLVPGVFLLVTAGLKIHGLYSDPYAQESTLLTPQLLVADTEGIHCACFLHLIDRARAPWGAVGVASEEGMPCSG